MVEQIPGWRYAAESHRAKYGLAQYDVDHLCTHVFFEKYTRLWSQCATLFGQVVSKVFAVADSAVV